MSSLPPLDGSLGPATLPYLVRDLWRSKATGTLLLDDRETTKQLFFDQGEIVFAGTNVDHERLGERLVRAGTIKRSVLDLSLRVMERSEERLGKTIVDLGWVSPERMQRFVAMQIKEIVYSVFTWKQGSYRFEVGTPNVPGDVALELMTAEVIYEGVSRIGDERAIRAGVGSWEKRLTLTGRQRLAIPITQDDGYVLSHLGEPSIREVVEESPLGEVATLRRIYALLLAGVVDVAEPRPKKLESRDESSRAEASGEEHLFRASVAARHAAFQFATFYDRLGVDWDASPEEIHDAFERVKDSLEPDESFRERVDDIAEEVAGVARKVREAYETLRLEPTRRRYDRSIGIRSSIHGHDATLRQGEVDSLGLSHPSETLDAGVEGPSFVVERPPSSTKDEPEESGDTSPPQSPAREG